MIHIKKIVV